MAYELVYTSAPEGLSRGSSGFCVVACTKGLGTRLVVTLEGLSAYKPLYPHYAPNAWDNPISRTHYIFEANGEQQHILSRICFNGVDHTQRSNKLASHLVLSNAETEVAQGGPSSLLLHEELFKDASWPIKAEYFPKQKEIPATVAKVQKCSRWESVMGDAGWAGYLAQTYIDFPNKNVYIAYNPEKNKDILPLIHEAISLLPDNLRWKVTFNTYFVNLPAGMSCSWRCCPADSDALRIAKRSPMNVIINITKPQQLEKDSELITIARTGIIKKPEEIIIAPELEENKKTENNYKNEKKIRPTKLNLNLSEAGVPNKAINLYRPQTEDMSNVINNQHCDADSVAGYEYTPSLGAQKKSAFIILLIICLLSVIIGGVYYFVSVSKEKQLYFSNSNEYNKLCELFDSVKSRLDKIKSKENKVKSEKQINELIEQVKELEQITDSIKRETEKLLTYQSLFEKYQQGKVTSGIIDDNTPRGLVEICDTLKNDLTRELSSLNKHLKERREKRKEQEIVAEEKTTIPEGKIDQPQTMTAQENTLPAQVPAEKSEQKVEKIAKQLPTDEPCYLWTKSIPFHNMKQEEKIDIHIGGIDPEKILLFLIPNMKPHKVESDLKCDPDEYANQSIIKTNFDKDTGVLTLISKNKYRPPVNTEILIELDGKEKLPLYFRLDISKIKLWSKNNDNLKIVISEKIKVSINASAMQLPTSYYAEDNLRCNSTPTLQLICSAPYKENIIIKKQNNEYIYEGEDVKIKDLISKERQLAKTEGEITNDIESIVNKLKSNNGLQKMLKDYQTNKGFVNNRDTLLNIEKLFNAEAKESPAPENLRKTIENKKSDIEKFSDKNKAEVSGWTLKYDEMKKGKENLVQELKKIPLKDLGLGSSDSDSFSEKKKKIGEELDKRKKEIEGAIRESTVVIVYNDQKYEQFSIKDLLE